MNQHEWTFQAAGDVMGPIGWHGRSHQFNSDRLGVASPHSPKPIATSIVSNPYREDPSHREILVWTPIFLEYRFWDRYLHNPGLEDCPRRAGRATRTCSYTFDRARENETDAILFHYIDVDSEMRDLPVRNDYQKWILFVEDPPYLHGKRMLDFEGLFNWTLSYRWVCSNCLLYDVFTSVCVYRKMAEFFFLQSSDNYESNFTRKLSNFFFVELKACNWPCFSHSL
jgi:hypothetical protein